MLKGHRVASRCCCPFKNLLSSVDSVMYNKALFHFTQLITNFSFPNSWSFHTAKGITSKSDRRFRRLRDCTAIPRAAECFSSYLSSCHCTGKQSRQLLHQSEISFSWSTEVHYTYFISSKVYCRIHERYSCETWAEREALHLFINKPSSGIRH